MSLFGALNTAISGLNAQSAAFSNIGDNVANSQTVGFKRVDTNFVDYLSVSNANENQSGAVVARPDYINSVQGTVTQTENPLDLAISGRGFFSVNRPIGNANGIPVFRPQPEFTRAGDFSQNRDGYLVNGSGDYLAGWPVDASGKPDQTKAVPIQVNRAPFSPIATRNAMLSANLPASSDGTAIPTQIPVTDPLGRDQKLNLSWSPAAGQASAWDVTITQDGSTAPLGSARLMFGSATSPGGVLGSITGAGGVTASASVPNGPATLQFNADFGAGTQPITLDLGHFGQADGLTQFAGSTFALRALSQDGVPPGSYTGVATRSNGDVAINYDNGQSKIIARVPIATFANPDALQRENGQAFTATADSGIPLYSNAGSNGAGTLVNSAVESSNVDIAKEFTKLIVAQRAYSANTKMVTTADELLASTIDLKR